jgi:hypothetical protein
VLIRHAAIGDGLGNSAATGALIMLSPAAAAGTFVRVDDGSVSEYLQIVGDNPVTDVAALDLPLQQSHPAGAQVMVYARNPIAPTGEGLTVDAGLGDRTIFIQCTTDLSTPPITWLIELAANGVSAICIPTTVTKTGTNSSGALLFTVALAQPLPAAFAMGSATTVTRLTPGAPVADTLDVAASGGDLLIYAGSATPLNAGDLIDIDPGTPIREVRRIGELCALSLAQPPSVDWPAGTQIAAVQGGAVNSLGGPATPAAPGDQQTILLTSRAGIVPGSVLLIGAGPQESAVVLSVPGPATAGLNPGPVILSATLANSYAAAIIVTLISTTTTTAAVAAGSQALSLASRVGINPGSVLQLGTAPTQEYGVVLAVQGARALAGPDPGTIVLDTPLSNSYASGAAVTELFLEPVFVGPASRTVLDAPAGEDPPTVMVTVPAGIWTAGGVIQATLPDGSIAFGTIAGAANASLLAVTVTDPVQNTHPAGSIVVPRDPLIAVQALDRGAWGQRVAIAVQDESPGLVARAAIVSLIGPTQLKLATLTGVQPGSYLEMSFPDGTPVDPATPLKVAAVNLSTTSITLDAAVSALQSGAIGTATPAAPITLRSREFSIGVYLYRHPDPAVPSRNTQIIQSELFHNLSMDPRHSRYFETVIGSINGPLRLSDNRPEGSSWLIRTLDVVRTHGLSPVALQAALQGPRLGPEALIDILPNGLQRPAQHRLQGGDDSLATVDDDMYIGGDNTDPRQRTGLFSLVNIPQISIVAVPGQGTSAIQAAVIDHCENALYRFAVLDPEYPDSASADMQAQRQSFDTKFAAIYYPWLTIPNPMPTNLASVSDFPVPPSGHVVGIYSRVDDSRGVFKAPANEVVQGITGLTRTLLKADQDILNPSPTNINVIRDFRRDGRGIRVWGARVMTSDDNYRYVPVKRLLMFIEQSLDVGLQDIVFEPNGPPLWASVERLIGNFLTTIWAAGGLQGATPDQSFFVRCDLTTMTQDDIDNGRLIALVGVAPVKPAEFVIIQITLNMTSNSQ